MASRVGAMIRPLGFSFWVHHSTRGGNGCPSTRLLPTPEPRFPTAPVLEPDVEVLGVEPEQADPRQHLARESGFAAGFADIDGSDPAFAHLVAETEPATIPQQQHRL